MTNPILSILIPAREEESVIAATISQFSSLSIPHEIIVCVNNSSGDVDNKTALIAASAGATVVQYTDSEPTAGKNRNRAAEIARGAYVVFIDAGVTIKNPTAFFTHALSLFSANEKLVGVTGPQYASPSIATRADRISFWLFNAGIQFQNNVLHKGEASGKCMMVTREAFITAKGFREDLHTREDGDFFARIAQFGTTRYDSSLAVYHDARRAHAIGWLALWYIWITNSVYFMFTNKVLAKDWKPIR